MPRFLQFFLFDFDDRDLRRQRLRFVFDAEPDVVPAVSETVDPVRVPMVLGAGIVAEDAEDRKSVV